MTALILLAYLIINLILCAVDINAYPQSLYFATFSLQVWGLVARRLGTMGLANIPIIWLFGIRNNLLIYLTGWEYVTFNRFHRWIARISTLQLLLHGICFTAFEFDKGGTARYIGMYASLWWTMGVTAIVLLCFNVLLISCLWLRNHFYDAFLLLHILLGVAVLITIYYHVEMWHGIFTPYVWATVGIWVFDRVARLARVLSLLSFRSSNKARVEYDATADVLRVDVTSFFTGSGVKPVPGAYYYIYTPARLLGWESHPFTLVAWPTSSAPTTSETSTQATGNEKDTNTHTSVNTGSVSSAASTASAPATSPETAYSFLIRPQAGFTARLKPSPSDTSRSTHTQTRLLLEGPYGAHRGPPVHRYAHMLVLCGGSGISVGIAAVHNARRRQSTNASRKLRLVWAVRELTLLESVAKRELAGAAAGDGDVVFDAYVTGSTSMLPGGGKLEVPHQMASCVRGYERPDLGDIIRATVTEIENEGNGPGSAARLAVVVCGPTQMTNDVRVQVAALVKEGKAVDLFAEHFGW